MLITLISLFLLLVGIFIFTIKVPFKYYKATLAWKYDICGCIGIICIVIGTFVFVISLTLILCVQIPKSIDYEKKLYERQVLVYRLENQEENIVGNELLYNNIVEFNNKLRSHKKYANNMWLNWFINEKIASLDYIEIEGVIYD